MKSSKPKGLKPSSHNSTEYLSKILEIQETKDVQKLMNLMKDVKTYDWTLQDMLEIFDYIDLHYSNFYFFTRWGIDYVSEQNKSCFMNMVFYLSCTSRTDEENNGGNKPYSPLNNPSNEEDYSSVSQTQDSQNKLILLEKINNLIIAMEIPELGTLIKVLINKNKISQLKVIEEKIYKCTKQPQSFTAFAMIFIRYRKHSQAKEILHQLRDRQLTRPQLIDIIIANITAEADKKSQISFDLEETINTQNQLCVFHAAKTCDYVAKKYYAKRNFLKAYHYGKIAYQLLPFVSNQYKYNVAFYLFMLRELDKAQKILEFSIQSKFEIPRAIIANLEGDIQSLKGNFARAREFYQQSYNLFYQGYKQARFDHYILTQVQKACFYNYIPSNKVVKNYFSMGQNLIRELQATKDQFTHQQIDSHLRNAIQLLQKHLQLAGVRLVDTYMYLAIAYAKRGQFPAAQANLQQAIKIIKKQLIELQPLQKWNFLIQIKNLIGINLSSQLIDQIDQLSEKIKQGIITIIHNYIQMGKQYLQRDSHETAQIAFNYVRRFPFYREVVNLQEFHRLVLGCYQVLQQFQKGFEYFQKQVQELFLCNKTLLLLQRYSESGINKEKLQLLFVKVQPSKEALGEYLSFIQIMIKKQYCPYAQTKLDHLQDTFSANALSKKYDVIGYLYSKIKDSNKAFMFLLKSLKINKNQFYLRKALETLSENLKNNHTLSAQEQNFLNNDELLNTQDQQILTILGRICEKRQKIKEALHFFRKCFIKNRNSQSYKNYYELCEKLNDKKEMIWSTQEMINRQLNEYDYYYGEKLTQISKSLCRLYKRLFQLSPEHAKKEDCNQVLLRNVYALHLENVVEELFKNKRLSSGQFIFQLIQIYVDYGKQSLAFTHIKNLIERYPRESAFLKLKWFCQTVHPQLVNNQQPQICHQCKSAILDQLSSSKHLAQLFFCLQVSNDDQFIQQFRCWMENLKKGGNNNQKQQKKSALNDLKRDMVDILALMKAAENRLTQRSYYLILMKRMLQLLNKKECDEKIYNEQLSYFDTIEQNGSPSFSNPYFKSLLTQIEHLNHNNQIFLLSFLFSFLGKQAKEKVEIVERCIGVQLKSINLAELKNAFLIKS